MGRIIPAFRRRPIGKAVARLEERLGVRLFHRSTRSITLTPEGSLFRDRCRRIACEIEAAELELSQTGEAPHGKLRVSLPLIGMLMMPAVMAFMRAYPEIDLDFTDRLVDVIDEGFNAVTLHALAPLRCLSLTLTGAYATVGPAGPPRIAAPRETLTTMPMAKFGRRYADDMVISADIGARALVANAIGWMTRENYLLALEAILTADIFPCCQTSRFHFGTGRHGKRGRAPPAVAPGLAEAISHLMLWDIPGAGNLGMLNEPEAFIRLHTRSRSPWQTDDCRF